MMLNARKPNGTELASIATEQHSYRLHLPLQRAGEILVDRIFQSHIGLGPDVGPAQDQCIDIPQKKGDVFALDNPGGGADFRGVVIGRFKAARTGRQRRTDR